MCCKVERRKRILKALRLHKAKVQLRKSPLKPQKSLDLDVAIFRYSIESFDWDNFTADYQHFEYSILFLDIVCQRGFCDILHWAFLHVEPLYSTNALDYVGSRQILQMLLENHWPFRYTDEAMHHAIMLEDHNIIDFWHALSHYTDNEVKFNAPYVLETASDGMLKNMALRFPDAFPSWLQRYQ